MTDSSSTQAIPPSVYLQPDPDKVVSDFMAHPPELGPGKYRVVWYRSPQHSGYETVLISVEAQWAVARSTEMTTDEIFERYAGDFDRQIAIKMASSEPPRNGVWTLDAGDIVPIA